MTVVKGVHDEECRKCERLLQCEGKIKAGMNCLRYKENKYGVNKSNR